MAVHRPWQEAFYTDDPKKAEADVEEMGLDYKWEDDGSLTAAFHHTGFMDHPVTGQRRKSLITPWDFEGSRYFVSGSGESSWVRGLRATARFHAGSSLCAGERDSSDRTGDQGS